MAFVETVTLVNRTDKPLICTYDGHTYDLKPGKNPGFPLAAVPYAMRQNPLMGSEDPYNPNKFTSLVGVEGDPKKPTTPLKQSKAIERLNRQQVKGIGRKATIEEGDPVSAFEARISDGSADIDGEAAART